MYVRLHSENFERTMLISQTTPDEHPPTPPPCRWPALITLPALAKFQLDWRHLCDVLFRSSCLFEHTLTAVCALPGYQYRRKYDEYSNILGTSKCSLYFRPDLYRFEVRLELCGAKAGALRRECPPRQSSFPLSVSTSDANAKPMASFHHFTSPRQVSARLAPLV